MWSIPLLFPQRIWDSLQKCVNKKYTSLCHWKKQIQASLNLSRVEESCLPLLGGGQGSLTRKEVAAAASPTSNQRTQSLDISELPKCHPLQDCPRWKARSYPTVPEMSFLPTLLFGPCSLKELCFFCPLTSYNHIAIIFGGFSNFPLDSDHLLVSHSFNLQSNPFRADMSAALILQMGETKPQRYQVVYLVIENSGRVRSWAQTRDFRILAT